LGLLQAQVLKLYTITLYIIIIHFHYKTRQQRLELIKALHFEVSTIGVFYLSLTVAVHRHQTFLKIFCNFLQILARLCLAFFFTQ